jgi:hypothetical protein
MADCSENMHYASSGRSEGREMQDKARLKLVVGRSATVLLYLGLVRRCIMCFPVKIGLATGCPLVLLTAA